MSLLERLQDAYSKTKNYENRNFISSQTALKIVTIDRIAEWSVSHPLCQEHRYEGPHRTDVLRGLARNLLVFVVLVFANLEFLTCQLMKSGSNDMMLFHNELFEGVCQRANLGAEQKERLVKYRKYVGVLFMHRGVQNVPEDCVLPFYKREDLKRAGANGVLYKVEISGLHLRGHTKTALFAEKRIRQDSTPIQDSDKSLLHEVKTLQAANHPNIIRLLAAFTSVTDESGYKVFNLHLLFPLAEMDLAHWMTANRIPSNVESLSKQERQKHLYRSIYGLVSGVSYLHREIDGMVITHHDLKPLNILVVDGKLKIADFGHAHLRSIDGGSATKASARLGTYEYQPPEYFNQDGSRAEGKHGRAFDVWATGCIIIELATLIVHDWQSDMVNTFRQERKKNQSSERKSPREIDQSADFSFHNNQVIVKSWLARLRQLGNSRQLNKVLRIANGMLASEPTNRVYMWEVLMDLHEILKPFDELIPDLEGDLCIPPPLGREKSIVCFGREEATKIFIKDSIRWNSETPLHRAARNHNRQRIIRLWELGWPLSLPDPNGETSLDIMKKSNDIKLRRLEKDVTCMIKGARYGDPQVIKMLLSRGFSPLMVNADGRSAMFEAIKYSQIRVIDYLLESKTTGQLMLLDKSDKLLPLHMAAKIGSVEVLERLLKYYPDVNILGWPRILGGDDSFTALHYAVRYSNVDAVRFLIRNKAQLAPTKEYEAKSWTILHEAIARCKRPELFEMLKLLLEADDYQKCINVRAFFQTPLMLIAINDEIDYFELLFKAGASIHSDSSKPSNPINTLVQHGRLDILKQYIHHFLPEDFKIRNNSGKTPLRQAQNGGHKEIAGLLKSRMAQIARESGSTKKIRHSAILRKFKEFWFIR